MKAKLERRGDKIVVRMNGRIDFEGQGSFRTNLTRFIGQSQPTNESPKKIIFNLEELEFVGSTGISSFVQTLRDLNASGATVAKYCNVGSEFERIMKAFDEDNGFEIYETEDMALQSFDGFGGLGDIRAKIPSA